MRRSPLVLLVTTTVAAMTVTACAGGDLGAPPPPPHRRGPDTARIEIIGSPATNVLTVQAAGGAVTLGGQVLATAWDLPGDDAAQVGIRPEYVEVVTAPTPNTFPTTLRGVRDHGPLRVRDLEPAGQRITATVAREDGVPTASQVLLHLPQATVLPYVGGHLAAAT